MPPSELDVGEADTQVRGSAAGEPADGFRGAQGPELADWAAQEGPGWRGDTLQQISALLAPSRSRFQSRLSAPSKAPEGVGLRSGGG